MPDRYLNIAAYRFVPLDDLTGRRRALKAACDAAGLRGTVLLSSEGINLFIAGEEGLLRGFLSSLTDQAEFLDLEVKESWSDHQPFNRMLVRLKKEIISMGVDGIDPGSNPAPKLKPRELKSWLDEGREILLLDVRNDYEVGVGTFTGASTIGLDHFRNFPTAVSKLPQSMKHQPIVMFCTGGIRCEKAGPYMQHQGFQKVFQLEGGILKYFEECGGAHYDGDCFVFDKRVALDSGLKESGLAMCFVCQAILSTEEQQSPEFVYEESCPHCVAELRAKSPAIQARNEQIKAAVAPLPGSTPYDNLRPIRIGERLDGTTLKHCVAELFPHLGNDYWEQEFRGGRVRLGEQIVGEATIVRSGQRYTHWFPDTVEPDVAADIEVIFEDESLVVVRKPAPLPTHPSGRFNRNTLSWILRTAFSMPGLRPIHRLDANTTGVVIFAKTKSSAGQMQRLFDAGDVTKTYLAQCIGVPPEERFDCRASITRLATAIGGRTIGDADALEAETQFVRLRIADDNTAIVEARPFSGRTNQIRLHLWHLGHPIVGDPLYLTEHRLGDIQTLDTQSALAEPMRLHAWRVEFPHPYTHEAMAFEARKPLWAARCE